jgi:acetyl-CoA acyltransferase
MATDRPLASTDRVGVVAGLRTPFCQAGTQLRRLSAVDLGAACIKELVQRAGVAPARIDTLVLGQMVPSVDWHNLAREVALAAGLPASLEAYGVSCGCLTSIRALTNVAEAIRCGQHTVGIAGGADSISNSPLRVPDRLRDALLAARQARGWGAKMRALGTISLPDLLPGEPGFARDLGSGERLGEAAEKMAKQNGIGREEQDRIALRSHRHAALAWREGRFAAEVMTLLPPPYDQPVDRDNGVREQLSPQALEAEPPVFDRRHGSVTAGNSAPPADGASGLLLTRESLARSLGLEPLGYLRAWAYAAVDPTTEPLMAPVLAVPVALARADLTLAQMDLVDMHEAFAAQVAANLRAMASRAFASRWLGRDEPLGEIDPDKLNVNGGSIAIGHPFAATGGRMVLSTLRELARRNGEFALLTFSAAGGLGAAVVLEAA